MDMSATYRSGAPAGVTLVADAFHLVKLANRKIDEAFRRLGYRTQHAHEELGLPRPLHYMLRYNIENLDPDHLAVIIGVLDADADGQQIAAVWIAKEHLRDLLALRAARTHVTPAPSAVRDKLASFYIWCADNDSVPEIKTLAKTIDKWQQPVIDAVLRYPDGARLVYSAIGSRSNQCSSAYISVNESPGPACRQHTMSGSPGNASGVGPSVSISRSETRPSWVAAPMAWTMMCRPVTTSRRPPAPP